jgi:hypothetical protein
MRVLDRTKKILDLANATTRFRCGYVSYLSLSFFWPAFSLCRWISPGPFNCHPICCQEFRLFEHRLGGLHFFVERIAILPQYLLDISAGFSNNLMVPQDVRLKPRCIFRLRELCVACLLSDAVETTESFNIHWRGRSLVGSLRRETLGLCFAIPGKVCPSFTCYWRPLCLRPTQNEGFSLFCLT